MFNLFTAKNELPKSSNANSESSYLLLTKTIQGTIETLNPQSGEYNVLVEEFIYPITTYDYYSSEILFYATTKPYDPVHSSSEKYMNSMQITGPWTKTALAVDFISDKVYLVDREAERLNIVDLQSRNYGVVLSDLDDPKDIVLDIERRLMFILQASSVIIHANF